jgi:enoyl-CoA hydratase/carnithine racemase
VRWPPSAVRTAKRVLQFGVATNDLRDALFHEAVGLGRARSGPNDVTEAMSAFWEKRQPRFTGT